MVGNGNAWSWASRFSSQLEIGVSHYKCMEMELLMEEFLESWRKLLWQATALKVTNLDVSRHE